MSGIANYTDDDIKTLSPREHIRLRPGMYIGKLGDGSAADDGIYVLIFLAKTHYKVNRQ